MELIFRIFGSEFTMTLGPTQYEEDTDCHLSINDSAFGFTVDPLNLEPLQEDED